MASSAKSSHGDSPECHLFAQHRAEYARLQEKIAAHHQEVTMMKLDARNIAAFFTVLLSPGADMRVQLLTSLTLCFNKPEGSSCCGMAVNLVSASEALSALCNLKNLTITGLPQPEKDGWILEHCTFSLEQFCTDIWYISPGLIDFLRGQKQLKTLLLIHNERYRRYDPDRDSLISHLNRNFLKSVKTLQCGGAFLVLLNVSRPNCLPPIVNLRLDMELDMLVMTKTLGALSRLSSSLVSLSIRFKNKYPASETSQDRERGVQSIAKIIHSFAEDESWTRLRFLEVRGTWYSTVARKDFLTAILTHFPRIRALIWIPSTFANETHRLQPKKVASKFLLRCPTLRRFIFVGPDTDVVNDPSYLSYMKVSVKDLYIQGKLDRFDDTWMDGEVFFDRTQFECRKEEAEMETAEEEREEVNE
ncbi:hypothetical protein BXZ70DRAFT_904018 [Cristinia sonorae]|uniref:Uncharacterized protein n=1 Tax=Cristinia sonorae TaxID=1940300 RepID=A0A8K0UVL2_9AGAR|nr:hypothetical protein BXZ70DRAFT_904018 [Cristinia sonorae]